MGLHDIKYTSSQGDLWSSDVVCLLDGNWAADRRMEGDGQKTDELRLTGLCQGRGGSCQGTAAGVLGPDGSVIRGH